VDVETYGYRWSNDSVVKADAKGGALVILPECYRLGKDRIPPSS
jgi:hypothetical protein